MLLRRAIWTLGLRYRVDVATLVGRPDLVFPRERVVVFCDGDFWHGRDLLARIAKLRKGSNAPYWVAGPSASDLILALACERARPEPGTRVSAVLALLSSELARHVLVRLGRRCLGPLRRKELQRRADR